MIFYRETTLRNLLRPTPIDPAVSPVRASGGINGKNPPKTPKKPGKAIPVDDNGLSFYDYLRAGQEIHRKNLEQKGKKLKCQ